jgi:hypothetical protein
LSNLPQKASHLRIKGQQTQSNTTTNGGGLIYADVTLGNPWRGGSRRKQKGIFALMNHHAPLPEAVVSEGRK